MTISENIIIGENIAWQADDILKAIDEKMPCGYPVWYAITTAMEHENLMYILSGLEMRHSAYLESNLKLLGLAASREEAGKIVLKIVQEGYNKGDILNMKKFLETM